jgi:hypothetical protein
MPTRSVVGSLTSEPTPISPDVLAFLSRNPTRLFSHGAPTGTSAVRGSVG